MTISAGQTITKADLNLESGAQRSTFNTAAVAGNKKHTIGLSVDEMDATAAKALEAQVDFIPDDDYFLSEVILMKWGAQSGVALTLTLSAPDDSTYLNDGTLTETMTTSTTTEETSRTGYTTVTSARYALLRGVRYRVAITADGAVDQVEGILVLEHFRRRR